jgi:hypothetical protein
MQYVYEISLGEYNYLQEKGDGNLIFQVQYVFKPCEKCIHALFGKMLSVLIILLRCYIYISQ